MGLITESQNFHACRKKKPKDKTNQQNQTGELFLEHICPEMSETDSGSNTGCGGLALASQHSLTCSLTPLSGVMGRKQKEVEKSCGSR